MGSRRRIWIMTIILSLPPFVAVLSMVFFAAGRYLHVSVLDLRTQVKTEPSTLPHRCDCRGCVFGDPLY